MQKPKDSNTRFFVVTVLTMCLGAIGLASLWPSVSHAYNQLASSLVKNGDQSTGRQAAADYILATWLDPHNHAAYMGLARTEVSIGQPGAALSDLAKAGQGSDSAELSVRILLELGRAQDAASATAPLTTQGSSDHDLLLASLTASAAGHPDQAAVLANRLSSPDLARRAVRANATRVALAQELYATGLLNASQGVLQSLPVSYERNMLLARINLHEGSSQSLHGATNLTLAALTLNPASLDARQLLATLYLKLGDPEQAAAQTSLVQKLTSGTP